MSLYSRSSSEFRVPEVGAVSADEAVICTPTGSVPVILPGSKDVLGTTLANLDEATDFLDYAIAHGRLGGWESVIIQHTSKQDVVDGPRHRVVTLALRSQLDTSVNLVQVVQALASDGSWDAVFAEKAEFAARMLLIKAIVRPSSVPLRFLSLVNKRLAGKEGTGRALLEAFLDQRQRGRGIGDHSANMAVEASSPSSNDAGVPRDPGLTPSSQVTATTSTQRVHPWSSPSSSLPSVALPSALHPQHRAAVTTPAEGPPPSDSERSTRPTGSSSALNASQRRGGNLGEQAPTPEATPEADVRHQCATSSLLCFQKEGQLLLLSPLGDWKSLCRFAFSVDSPATIERLRRSVPADSATPSHHLPLRARAIFCRTKGVDNATWPMLSIACNDSVIPASRSKIMQGSPIPQSLAVDLSPYLVVGDNTLRLAKWKMESLPSDLCIGVELYSCFSNAWARAQIRAEDERTFELYDKRSRLDAQQHISIIDRRSGRRIVTPVRGEHCQHLETFDLDAHLLYNAEAVMPDWLCPICSAPAPPTELAICQWHASALETVTADVELLEVHKKSDVSVKMEE